MPQSSREWMSQQTHPKVGLSGAQGNCKELQELHLGLIGLISKLFEDPHSTVQKIIHTHTYTHKKRERLFTSGKHLTAASLQKNMPLLFSLFKLVTWHAFILHFFVDVSLQSLKRLPADRFSLKSPCIAFHTHHLLAQGSY